jgi:CHAT domain-containing protein
VHFDSLPGSEGELLKIKDTYQKNFGSAGLTVLEGTAASEESLRREAPRHLYLHLATHGFFAPAEVRSALDAPVNPGERPGWELSREQRVTGYHPDLLSGIALAGANNPVAEGDDGILTASEVAALDLSAVQVCVLSACETGLGQTAGGEGLLGLQRAFQVAGARTVVASLWKVDDRATRDLMERFYENLWDREMGKLAALREAQLWMLNERGRRGLDLPDDGTAPQRLPPFYWAAFVLSGDWR